MVIKELNNYEHLEVGKNPIKKSEGGILKSTSSEEVLTNNVEKESEEVVKTNRIQLECDVCEYKCKNKNTLTKHLDLKHGGHKQCFICETRFFTDETLKTHEDMHTDDEMLDSLRRLCDSVTNQ
jgi:hypothetical protein